MKFFSKETATEKVLILLFFLIGLIEVVTQIYAGSCIQYLIMPVQAVLLSVLYWSTSTEKKWLFFVTIFSLLVGRLYFIPNQQDLLFYALIALFFHRIAQIYYIVKLIKLKDFIPSVLASIPFLIFFLYLVSIPESALVKSYVILVVQIILISILSGIILSQYLSFYDKRSIWLFVFGIMSLVQTFIVLLEKFYFQDFLITSLRPLSQFLNSVICFSFYKFVIAAEKLNND
ncbi:MULTISPECIES: hypothetical protein [unclassified Flavobacterium]|uniref:hypothetical protein n=1 Tax=unclassified Flavobacterium TaxID=196869 RepID=UPI003F90EDE9